MKINKLFDITTKKILITGASQGSGKIIARSLLENGAKVILTDKSLLSLKKAFPISKYNKKQFYLFASDLSKSKSIQKLCDYINKDHVDLSAIINNAGITKPNKLNNYTDKDWELTHKINLKAPFLIVRKLLKLLIKNKKFNPSIINITSLNSGGDIHLI